MFRPYKARDPTRQIGERTEPMLGTQVERDARVWRFDLPRVSGNTSVPFRLHARARAGRQLRNGRALSAPLFAVQSFIARAFGGIKPHRSFVVRQPAVPREGAMSQGRNPKDLVLATPRRVIGGFVLAILTVLIVGIVTLIGLSERTRNVRSRRFFGLRRS
jgi:hypothetical protein